MHDHSITSLVIVITVAFLTPILLYRLRLNVIPVVVAEILMGLIIGKSGLNLVESGMWIDTLSTLGFIFLMFLSGVEIDFTVFASKKKKEILPSGKQAPNTFFVATMIFIGILILSVILSYIFVWVGFIDNAFLMTLVISTISLGVVVPTLKEAQITKSNIGQIILLVAVIADLVTMILLAFFVSIYSEDSGNIWLLLVLFGAGVLLYLFGKYFRHQSFLETMSKGTIQIGTRAIFALIIFLVALSETLGAENILGAFLAGVLVSLLSPNHDMVQKLDSFGYGFLIPIFFVMVGVNLDLQSIFSNPKILLLIPFLIIGLIISKIFPVLYLKKWYDMKTTLAAASLLTSTLSLVIAAATIGEQIGVINDQMADALVLVAVITSIITPIGFKKLFPKHIADGHKKKVSFIGVNQYTLPVTMELPASKYECTLYHVKQEKIEQISNSVFNIVDIDDYSIESLLNANVFDADIVVITAGDEAVNAKLAKYAKEYGVERVIARAETSEIEKDLKEHNVDVFSILTSTKTLMKALIQSPSVINILTNNESALAQININNPTYHGLHIKKFPFTGDVIFVRIFRGKDSIVPHGETELKLGDKLIVTGTREYVDELKSVLEYGE